MGKYSKFSAAYLDHCEKNNLIPTEEGCKLWLIEQIDKLTIRKEK